MRRRRKKYWSDWHKQDHAKKKALAEAVAAKPESEWTDDETAFAAEEAAKREKRREYMREYGRKRSAAKETACLAAAAP